MQREEHLSRPETAHGGEPAATPAVSNTTEPEANKRDDCREGSSTCRDGSPACREGSAKLVQKNDQLAEIVANQDRKTGN